MLKILKRVVLLVIGLILVLVIGLAGTVAVDGLSMGGKVDALTNTRIPNASGPEIRAYVARPDTPGPHPAVIMIHEFWGIREELIGKADDLAAQGYLVVAPDLFRGRTTNMVPSAIYNVLSNQPAQIDGDVESVFLWLSTQTDVKANRIAIMGFCFGGGTSIRYSVSNPKLAGTIVFYGTPVTDAAKLKSLSGPVLGIFGGADTSIPLEQVRAFEAGLKQAGVPNEITIYDGQPHAFVTDMAAIRAGGPQGQAWAQLIKFLDGTLKQSAIERRDVIARAPDAGIDYVYLLRLAYEHTLGHGATHH
jgi:carboxymethylenebutenolidase